MSHDCGESGETYHIQDMAANGIHHEEKQKIALDEDSEVETRRSSSKSTLLYIVAGALVIALLVLVLGLYFGLKRDDAKFLPSVAATKSLCRAGKEFGKFSVSTDTSKCSEIGCHILEKGGSAVDAAIAAMLCISVVTMHSSGIGGGGFMLIYEKKSRKTVFIDARETAPGAASERMYVNNTDNARNGPLSAGVPGEVKGMAEAHKLYGKLEWRDLVQPSIELASEGFRVTAALEKAMSRLKIIDPEFRRLLTNDDGEFKKEGDIIVNKKLAATLREIQNEPDCFYTGKLARKIAADFQNNGGLITEEDLKRYKANVKRDVLRLDLDDITMLSGPPPSGGPVVTQILNILQNYKFNGASIADVNSTTLTYHRIIEAFKFAYSRRPYLGDPDFVKDSKFKEIVKQTADVEFNEKLFEKISDNATHNTSYYGGYEFNAVRDMGSTSHLSVLAPNGDAVSVTGSINYHFGGKFRSNVTGILYNNEMDDFSTPGLVNLFGYLPAANNFIAPGKRPLSSMSPTIFVDRKTGDVRLAVGAAGGSRIISSIAWVSLLNLWMGLPINDAVTRSRLHHQFLPTIVQTEPLEDYQVEEGVKMGLKQKGHVLVTARGLSVVQAIAFNPKEKSIQAASDPRKGGKAWGL